MPTITDVTVQDIRVPTSDELLGSDPFHKKPDYFAIWDQICVAGHSGNQLVEYIDFLQEGVFKNPVEISNGAYGLPSNPGWGLEMEPDFVKNHIYPEGSVWCGRQEPSGVTFLAD